MNKKNRAGVVVRNKQNEVLVIHRFCEGREYYVFPGGSVEDNETVEQAAVREAAEELTLNVALGKELLRLTNEDREEVYYLVEQFTGEPVLGGEEKERMNDDDQYHLEWKNKEKLEKAEPFFPQEVKQEVLKLLS